MDKETARRLLNKAQDVRYLGYSFSPEVEQLAEEVIELRDAIAIYCREEMAEMDFETDDEAVNYFKYFATENGG